MSQTLAIAVISDVVCPWCYIGKRRLERARSATDADLSVRWRPYQLDATIPPEGHPRRAYMEAKFGSPERYRQIYEAVKTAGDEVGIDFAFDLIERSPNTLDAHRVIRWAGGQGEDVQDRVVEALFRAFFLEGRDIGRHEVLSEVADGNGLDGTLVAELLAEGRDVDAVRQEIEAAQRMGVTGVPTFIVAERYALQGAQHEDVLAQAFEQIAKDPPQAA